MFKLFSSISRFFRAILYTFAGDVSKWSEVREASTGYITAEFEDIEKAIAKDADDAASAYAEMKVIVKEKENRLRTITAEVEDLKKKMMGAQAAAQKRVDTLKTQGLPASDIQKDSEVLRCLEFYERFKQKLEDKQDEGDRLDTDLTNSQSQLDRMYRIVERQAVELKSVKQKKVEIIADHRMADSEERVAAMVTGIGSDRNDVAERLRRQEDLRNKRKAKAEALSELSGARQSDVEEEFLQYAAGEVATSEFFSNIGIADESQNEQRVSSETIPQIPE